MRTRGHVPHGMARKGSQRLELETIVTTTFRRGETSRQKPQVRIATADLYAERSQSKVQINPRSGCLSLTRCVQ